MLLLLINNYKMYNNNYILVHNYVHSDKRFCKTDLPITEADVIKINTIIYALNDQQFHQLTSRSIILLYAIRF